jgi:RNA polymerase sigma-70 factor (ECF subfamily)
MRPQILTYPAMKKSRTFDELLGLKESAEPDAPALVRTKEELIQLWYERFAESLYAYLRSVYDGVPAQTAEDAVSEAFLRLYDELCRGKSIENPQAWVWTVARRWMLSEIRRAGSADKKHRIFAPLASRSNPTPEEELCEKCKRAAFGRTLSVLPEIERTCLELRASGLKLAEIGKIVGRDHRRVAEIIARAVQRLAEKVDE